MIRCRALCSPICLRFQSACHFPLALAIFVAFDLAKAKANGASCPKKIRPGLVRSDFLVASLRGAVD